MAKVPQNPTPRNEGNCTDGEYNYIKIGNIYIVSYCVKNQVDNVQAGNACAIPGHIGLPPGSTGQYPGNTGANPQPECDPCICGDCQALNCDGLSDYATSTASCIVGDTAYRAIKVGTQCWMDKNINLGSMITGVSHPLTSTDSIIEKWCYNNSESNCTVDGAIYCFTEMMYLPAICSGYATSTACWPTQYVAGSGVSAKRQGICPKGWHIPSDYEFWVLENYVDSSVADDDPNYYADQDPTLGVNENGNRGIDVGTKLKIGGSTHLNFTMSGYRDWDGSFQNYGTMNWLWTSSRRGGYLWTRNLFSSAAFSGRGLALASTRGLSLRCLKD